MLFKSAKQCLNPLAYLDYLEPYHYVTNIVVFMNAGFRSSKQISSVLVKLCLLLSFKASSKALASLVKEILVFPGRIKMWFLLNLILTITMHFMQQSVRPPVCSKHCWLKNKRIDFEILKIKKVYLQNIQWSSLHPALKLF